MNAKTLRFAAAAASVLAASSAAAALNLADAVDLPFAEAYAFSSNRAARVATLPPGSPQWYTYSILLAQTEGRLGDAAELLARWRSNLVDGDSVETLRSLEGRQTLLGWDDGRPNLVQLRTALGNAGICVNSRPRETALAPDTYPSRLDPAEISFDRFLRDRPLNRRFAFLPVTGEDGLDRAHWTFDPYAEGLLPDTPGLFEQALAWLKAPNAAHVFRRTALFRSFTRDQLDRLAEAMAGTERDLRANRAFAETVLEKIGPGADDDRNDLAVRTAVARRRIAFAGTLLTPLDDLKAKELRAYLELMRAQGRQADARAEFQTYVSLIARAQGMQVRRVRPDDVVADYLASYRRAGDDLSALAPLIEQTDFARICAAADLLAGVDPAKVDAGCFSPEEFKALQERVELTWSGANAKTFDADADVSLALDVKNVKRLRVAVYVLDPFAACRILDGEAKADLDLDAAVPTFARTVDCSAFAPVVRHTVKLDLPELKLPGVYVVDCTGGGVASRALVRKGRLRATHRRDAAGHVFTVIDRHGAVVKGTKLRLGETVFAADESGEIAVPFAGDERTAGRKTAVVTDGRLAATVSFVHETEKAELSLAAVLPGEALVAGETATALLRPRLRISGADAPLVLLKSPVVTACFTDLDGRVSVKEFPAAALADDAESSVGFTVPERLASVSFSLSGTVASSVTGRDEPLTATTATVCANRVRKTEATRQAFLRRSADGWRIELRGLTGEPLPSRALRIAFRHVAFSRVREVTLQADAHGVIELGRLPDIAALEFGFGGHYAFDLAAAATLPLPESLSAAADEKFELPLRDLFAGEWPGAAKMACRLSLLEMNADGQVVADRLSACTYADGVLTIAGLGPGDYLLTLRDRGAACRLYVADAPVKSAGAAGVLASGGRSLTDTGAPALLRIAAAGRGADGALAVRLANATPETRVHVFASRMFASGRLDWSPDRRPVVVGTWGGRSSDYVSGRDLGERLRYILDRREQPRRIGNMLFKPSLLLAPWSTAETETQDIKLKAGEDWDEVSPAALDEAGERSSGSRAYGGMAPRDDYVSLDFLPEAAQVVANARPGADGRLAVRLPAGLQDVTVVATDGRAVDRVTVAGGLVPFAPRDLTHREARMSERALVRGYPTLESLYTLACSLNPDAPELTLFRPLAAWPRLSAEEKRAFYGEHVCHELDFFLYMKDRAFFDAVVAPHLANKRVKQFMDRWLLGEDLAEYAAPGRLDELNALEQCLLAWRVPAAAPQVARRMADFCVAHPTRPEEADAAFDIALDAMRAHKARGDDDDAVAAPGVNELMSLAAAPAAASAPQMESAGFGGARLSRGRAAAGALRAAPDLKARRAQEVARRKNRPLYRPPERTREWVESNWWRRRQGAADAPRVPVNEFWRDWSAALAAGGAGGIRSQNLCLVRSGFTAALAALAATDVPFAAQEGDEGLVFRRSAPAASGKASPVVVTQRFRDPHAARADGSLGAEVGGEFVRGRVYELVTVMTNPTDARRRVAVSVQVPEGALALAGAREAACATGVLEPYSVQVEAVKFYFPTGADDASCRLPPATVAEADGAASTAGAFACRVVARPSQTDETSWAYVSQNGSKGAVLAYLAEKNLADVDLGKIQWRLADGAFASKALDVLAKRGVYDQDLWLAGLLWKDAYDPARLREALARRENAERLGRAFGPALASPLATVDPEASGVFEHKEYWPMVNARAHFVGGRAAIANEGLRDAYRAFLDTLAAKKAPTARDRILAAVYLLAQDRVDEAKAQVAAARPEAGDCRMQLDYLRAYLAFCDGDAPGGRAIAARYADYPVPLWRDRFREVVAQADEALGRARAVPGAASDADAAPALAIADGGTSVSLTGRNLAECLLKAYPVDVEVAFSDDPFGTSAKRRDALLCLVPKWSRSVKLGRDGAAQVELPADLRARSVVLVAEGAEGRAEARLARAPRDFDVQVVREYRQLRVKGADGRPLAGAYVKVYARDARGQSVEFHKDGYTDLRGAFDYAGVSTDTSFRPAEYAILVLREGGGSATLTVKAGGEAEPPGAVML